MFVFFVQILPSWFLRGLGARRTLIPAIFCAQEPLPTLLSNVCQKRVFNIFDKFLWQTKSMYPTKPRAISGVDVVAHDLRSAAFSHLHCIHMCSEIFF